MNRPEWAKAKVRLHLATCWMGIDEDGIPLIQGVNWFNDSVLLPISTFIHKCLIAPFRDEGFPFRIIEQYEAFDNILEDDDVD